MFGRGRKPRPDVGLADLTGSDGRVTLPPDSPVPTPALTPVPVDVEQAYRAAGVDLPGLRPQRGRDNGVTVWRVERDDAYDAEQTWERLRDLHAGTGLWPVLVSEPFWERFDEQEVDPAPDRGDGWSWLQGRLGDKSGSKNAQSLASEFPRRPDLEWSQETDFDWVDSLAALDDQPDSIVLVPAAASWLVPGAIGWDGAVNTEVMGPEHASVLRRWSAAYGAELVFLGSDVLALRVARPPADREQALRAAVEAVAYCPDAIFQGTGSLEALATALSAPLWVFWWD